MVIADPAPGTRQLRADAVGTRCGADDGHHAVLAVLITEVFKHADQAVATPNHEPAPMRPAPRFYNGLFVGVTMNLGRAGEFMFVVKKKEAAKLHDHSPTSGPGSIQILQAICQGKSIRYQIAMSSRWPTPSPTAPTN